jgi:hypothetical protein
MANDPQESADVTADDELSDQVLSGVSDGNPGVQSGPIFVPFDNGGAGGG